MPGTQLQTLQDDLAAKIKEVEESLKENNNGLLPSPTKKLSEQIKELVAAQSQKPQVPSIAAGKTPTSSSSSVQRYFTKKRYNEVKGVNKQTEQISVLVSICTQEFQLTPEFLFRKAAKKNFHQPH